MTLSVVLTLLLFLLLPTSALYECGGNYDLFDSKVIGGLESDKGYAVEEGQFNWALNQSAYAANPSLSMPPVCFCLFASH